MANEKDEKKLSPKKEAFVQHYLVHWNAAKAARLAGYSPKTSHEKGAQLLAEPDVAEAIEQRKEELAHAMGVTQERVLDELARIAFSDVGEFLEVTADGVRFTIPEFADTRVLAQVEEIPTKNGKRTGLKMYDKLAALNALAKYTNVIPTGGSSMSINAGGPVEIVIAAAPENGE